MPVTSPAGTLVGRFWAGIARHHPGIKPSLLLPPDVVATGKRRMNIKTRTVTGADVIK
ncbi:hypothetical protein ACWDX6_08645 [Streptomyces sp. NPDC003027]